MIIIVTGGLGLIGHNVVALLEQLGHDVIVTDMCTNYGIIPQNELEYLISERTKKIKATNRLHKIDISDRDSIDWIFDFYKPNIVIHIASPSRQNIVYANPQLSMRSMSEGLINLLEAGINCSIYKFVYISSSMVYGDFNDNVKESHNCKPEGLYGIMKLAGEWITQDYTRKLGMRHTIIRPTAVYGPLDVGDRVVAKFMLAAMRGSTLKVNGANENLDFTYIDDIANGIVAASLSDRTNNRIYNISKSRSISLYKAASMVIEIVGSGDIELCVKDITFPSRGALNIDAARKDFGYDPQVDVEEGFQNYYIWFKNSSYWQQHL